MNWNAPSLGRSGARASRPAKIVFHTPALFRGYRETMRTAAIACVLALTALPAAAQQPRGAQEQAQPPARGEEWYRTQLVELAEVLGGAHYLRIICDGRDDQRWRNYMRGVIQREPTYNGLLVESFNRGYRNEEARFPECDSTTRQMEAELRARGLRVAQGLSARHADR